MGEAKGAPDWGLGQVQSVVGNRVTVNFENVGKRIVHSDVVPIEIVDMSGEQL
jgi:hypothetical protein